MVQGTQKKLWILTKLWHLWAHRTIAQRKHKMEKNIEQKYKFNSKRKMPMLEHHHCQFSINLLTSNIHRYQQKRTGNGPSFFDNIICKRRRHHSLDGIPSMPRTEMLASWQNFTPFSQFRETCCRSHDPVYRSRDISLAGWKHYQRPWVTKQH
jgi:hypothetical protein